MCTQHCLGDRLNHRLGTSAIDGIDAFWVHKYEVLGVLNVDLLGHIAVARRAHSSVHMTNRATYSKVLGVMTLPFGLKAWELKAFLSLDVLVSLTSCTYVD